MRFDVSRATRLTGAALALAAGGIVVLGVAPASAATSTTYWVQSPYHYSKPPGFRVLIAATQAGADKKCVATYGFRARETSPNYWANNGVDINATYSVNWTCHSN